jgi:large subunit ribosomal protein L3
MPERHHPRRGSKGYSPRKRTRSETPRIYSWPKGGDKPRLQGFAGFKAGMTHVLIRDYRPTSTTSGQEVIVPVTIIETPPLKITAIRTYDTTPYGLRATGEIRDKKDKPGKGDEIRVMAQTNPQLVSGIPKKKPDEIEIRIGGGTREERLQYATNILDTEIDIAKVIEEGAMIDIIATTKGKGFQGHIKRWGVKLLPHKNSKHRRMIGTLGPWHPSYVRSTVPQAGQTGYHKRTEYNKRILRIGENGEEITPAGGFPHYGIIKNKYLIIHGSTPGPAKRLLRIREAIRYTRGIRVEKPEITYISTTSKQGR